MSAPLKIAQTLKIMHAGTTLPMLLNPRISQRIFKTSYLVLHRNFCWNSFTKPAVLRTSLQTTNPLVKYYSRLVLQAVKRQNGVTPRPVIWNLFIRRGFVNKTSPDKVKKRNRSSGIYLVSILVFMVGLSHAAVPLYRLFCQATGSGGQSRDAKGHNADMVESMVPVKDRQIRVRFNADLAASMRWNFRPQQSEVVVSPGETALAFYTAKNPTDKPIIGISTYNVVPFEAGQYFNKIQCFCFEEQRLNPHEQVDMPVFFFIDPSYTEDPSLANTNVITLSYTFFEAKEGLQLPLPGYVQNPA